MLTHLGLGQRKFEQVWVHEPEQVLLQQPAIDLPSRRCEDQTGAIYSRTDCTVVRVELRPLPWGYTATDPQVRR